MKVLVLFDMARRAAPGETFSPEVLKETEDKETEADVLACLQRLGHDVHVVLGSERNIKITKPADMDLARFYLERERERSAR